MEGQPEQAVLRDAAMHLVHRQQHAAHAVGRVHLHDAERLALGDPQLAVGPPGDLPRRGEAVATTRIVNRSGALATVVGPCTPTVDPSTTRRTAAAEIVRITSALSVL